MNSCVDVRRIPRTQDQNYYQRSHPIRAMTSANPPLPTLAELQTLVRTGESACRDFYDYYAVTQPPYLFEPSMDDSTRERLRDIGHRRFPLDSNQTQEYLDVSGSVYASLCCNTLLGHVLSGAETDQDTLGGIAYSLKELSGWGCWVGEPTAGSWGRLPAAVRDPLTEWHQKRSQIHPRLEQWA